jgi:hypothetical protein
LEKLIENHLQQHERVESQRPDPLIEFIEAGSIEPVDLSLDHPSLVFLFEFLIDLFPASMAGRQWKRAEQAFLIDPIGLSS